MRILLISARYFPHRGGLESVVYHLASEFQKHGHIVEIITNRYPRTLPRREEMDGVIVTRLHFFRPDLKYLRNHRIDLWLAGLWYRFYTKLVMRRLINEFQPDVINNHYLNEIAEFVAACLESHSPAVPWVVSLHGADVDAEPFLDRSNRERFCKLSQQANGLTACSKFLAAQAGTLEPALNGHITVVYNGVDTHRFSSAVPFPAVTPYILAVGQLAAHKGFDLLIEAFAHVSGKHPKVQLRIVGEGAQRTGLETLISRKKLVQCVQLLGNVGEQMIASLMAGCLFVVMPSRREPFGIVALEGMAAGKSVIASNVGGLPEFLSVPPNRLVAPQVGALAAALDEYLSLATRKQLRADGNAQAALQFDWAKVAGQYLQVYQQVLRHD